MSSIEWTGRTWNPITGCDRISHGCDNCYALRLSRRLKAMGQAKYQQDGDPRTSGPGFGLTEHPDALTEPLRWRKPQVVFVNSMSDVGHARVTRAFLAQILAVMLATRHHTFQVLTKRPGKLEALLNDGAFIASVSELALGYGADPAHLGWPAANIWLGTSIESDRFTWRARTIERSPAAVRFLSLEPLLGPLPSLDLSGIDWVIAGGESGPGHRPLDLDWVRDIRDRCVDQRVAFFFKQVGGVTPKAGGRLLDGRVWDEMPIVPPADSTGISRACRSSLKPIIG